MSRRLSITVSDDLWDAVSHLDDTQSGVVQKALILLRDEEGEVARTDFEKAAEDIPTYQTALAVASPQLKNLRSIPLPLQK